MTAMQKLKWFISDGMDNYDERMTVSEIWGKINELLEVEKQQIINAHANGNENFTMPDNNYLISAKEYYDETYSDNNKTSEL